MLGAFLCGCSFTHGALPGTSDDAALDAPTDGDTTTGDVLLAQPLCLGSGTYEVCAQADTSVVLAGPIDTMTSDLCASSQLWTDIGQPSTCFIVGTGITVASATTASFFGPRPVVLFASGSISIDGTLDVSSHRSPAVVGPGWPSLACDPFERDPGNSSSGAAGGAGGTFMSQGGDGGDGETNKTEGLPSAAATSPAVLRAGCDGQQGGEGDGDAGAPGRGGGAIYVVAAGAIAVNGVINASGSGAVATTTAKSGGSGGGSGGMIKLHATIIAGAGVLMANGGGGASGAANDDLNPGLPGSDPSTATPTTAAGGGGRVENSGAGGVGFAGTTPAANGGEGTGNNTGGGGGGGGGGFIQTNQALGSITASAGVIDEP